MQSLQHLYVEQLRDIYDAETQLVSALPRMAQSAASPHLQQAFEQHSDQTRRHVQRLEEVFTAMRKTPYGETCEAMRGLIREGEKHMRRAELSPGARDAALIAAAQRVEHYEIAAYGTVCAYAVELDDATGLRLLRDTLSEEKQADHRLGALVEEVMAPLPAYTQEPGLAALYRDFASARAAIEALVNAGVSHERLSLIANYKDERYAAIIRTMKLTDDPSESPSVEEGAGFGAIVGALAGLGIALIPGVGGFVVTGVAGAALFAGVGAAAGAVTGGLTSGLIDIGIDEAHAGAYTNGLGSGGAMVIAHVDDQGREQVETILRWYHPTELQPIGRL